MSSTARWRGFIFASAVGAGFSAFAVMRFWNPWLLIVLLGPIVIPILVYRPVLVASVAIAFTFINPSLLPPVIEFGELTVRWIDISLVALCYILFLRTCMLRRLAGLKEWKKVFKPVLILIGYIGLSLLWVWLKTPDLFGVSFASFLRLGMTVFLGWLIFLSVSDEKDLYLLKHFFLIGLLGTFGIGLWEAAKMGLLARRYGGLLGVNSFGLISGLLVLYGWLKWRENHHIDGICIAALGVLGLIASKSASSILATSVTVALVWAGRKGFRLFYSYRFLRNAIIGVVFIGLSVLSIWWLRRSDVEGLLELAGGSFAQRLMIAYAALLIFSRNPLLGTGWQASGSHIYIGDPNLNVALMNKFASLPQHYFFIERPTSLHNMYLQLLAELGIVGFCIFLFAFVRLYKTFKEWLPDIRKVLPQQSLWAHFACMGLVFLLVWWNTNPLYGGQTESLLVVFFLSLLASIKRLSQEHFRLGVRTTRMTR
ncbi:MAG: O-antigen ligase family protein [Candidatus Bathyarchaeia archaeon]